MEMLTLADLIQVCNDEGRNAEDVRIMFNDQRGGIIDVCLCDGGENVVWGLSESTFVITRLEA